MRIVCVSDTHNQLSDLSDQIPDGDVLIHAGDLTMGGRLREVATELQALAALPHRLKIGVAGNHDFLFQRDPETAAGLVAAVADRGVVYLQDSSTTHRGVVFYGSPWQPRFYDWAFNADRGKDIRRHWDRIPSCDVLITHGPPRGYGDMTDRGERVGCVDLADAVARARPKLHVFGHIHSGRGIHYGEGPCARTDFVNASLLSEDYRTTGVAAIVYDL